MGRGLTRSRSVLPVKRKRSHSRSVAGQLVEIENDFEIMEESIENPDVHERYKIAARITNIVLAELVSGCIAGASVYELCKAADAKITELTSLEFSKTLDEDCNPIYRGIAFPTCVSANEKICHYHPVDKEVQDVYLRGGDVVRVELGAHIDGYIANAAHTLIIEREKSSKEDDTSKMLHEIDSSINCDVLRAAYTAGEAALRLMKPGGNNHEVTDIFRSVAHSFGVLPYQGVVSHRMKRFDELGSQVILGWQNLDDNVMQETVIFQPGQVWSLDIAMMNGGQNKLMTKCKTVADSFIFRRSEVVRNMRVKSARYVLAVLRENGPCGTLPFTREWFDEIGPARLGIHMLAKEQLIDKFPVLFARNSTGCLGRYKWTVLITHKGVERLTGLPVPSYASVQPERMSTEVRNLLSQSLLLVSKNEKKADARKKSKILLLKSK